MLDPGAYGFRPVTPADILLIRHWRSEPHVVQWWGPPDVEDPGDILGDQRVAMWIVEHRGHPFAYAQDYSPHDWNPHPFSQLPPGSRGIDQFIGEPGMLGRGHGSAFVRLHCERLFAAGAPAIGTDPHPDNGRAIAGYRKAGFRAIGDPVETRWGTAVLMENWAQDARRPRRPDERRNDGPLPAQL